jgi:hypothetical protein
MGHNITYISQVIIGILALGLLLCSNSGIVLIQKAHAAPHGVIISPYYLKQLNVIRQPCIYDVTCIDKFLTPLIPIKNHTFVIINNLPTKTYNTDNVPFELPFPWSLLGEPATSIRRVRQTNCALLDFIVGGIQLDIRDTTQQLQDNNYSYYDLTTSTCFTNLKLTSVGIWGKLSDSN